MKAKVFKSGNSQAVRLPKGFRLDVREVEIFKRGKEVVLRPMVKSWEYYSPEDGLPKRCVANLDTIVTIRKELLIERITMLQNEKVEQIEAAIKFALCIP